MIFKKLYFLIPYVMLSVLFLWIASKGKEHILASSTFYETFTMAQKSALFYLSKIFLPTGLTVIYPFQGTLSLKLPEFFIPLLINAAFIVLALLEIRKRPLISFGILFYYVTLLPTLFNFHKGDLMFFAVDRYAYLPEIGVLIFVLALAFKIMNISQLKPLYAALVLVPLVLVLGTVSFLQTDVWDTADSLFGRSLSLYPQSVSARMAIGSILRERNLLDEAFKVLHDGARFSDHPGLNIEAGLVYSANGQVEDARNQFKMALTKDPTLAPAEYYLGFLAAHDGDKAGAIDWYQKAVSHDPSYVTVRIHLADLLIEEKEFGQAKEQIDQALKWNPVSVEALEEKVKLKKLNGDQDLGFWESELEKAKQ